MGFGVEGFGIRDGPSRDAATRVVPLRDDPRLVELHTIVGFRGQEFLCIVYCVWCMVYSVWCQVSSLGFRVQGSNFRVHG